MKMKHLITLFMLLFLFSCSSSKRQSFYKAQIVEDRSKRVSEYQDMADMRHYLHLVMDNYLEFCKQDSIFTGEYRMSNRAPSGIAFSKNWKREKVMAPRKPTLLHFIMWLELTEKTNK